MDYGLACRYLGSDGVHKEYKYDGRKAHDGTIEFTSRDAHIGGGFLCFCLSLVYLIFITGLFLYRFITIEFIQGCTHRRWVLRLYLFSGLKYTSTLKYVQLVHTNCEIYQRGRVSTVADTELILTIADLSDRRLS